MKRKILILISLLCAVISRTTAQKTLTTTIDKYVVPVCIYEGDTIPSLQIPQISVFRPLVFKNNRAKKRYSRLVRNVKKTLPIAKEINSIIIETYEYLQTLPDEKSRKEHLKRVEKSLKEQYTPRMKKLTFSQGKLLIKLVNRQTRSSSYELVKAFMGSFKAGFYQTFASLFGASLKKEYHPEEDENDAMVERVIIQIESGAL